jgi:hypothetical protein
VKALKFVGGEGESAGLYKYFSVNLKTKQNKIIKITKKNIKITKQKY